MKSISTLLVAAAIAFGLTFNSCNAVKNANGTQKGVGIGAAAGAVLGAVIGNNIGDKNNSELGALLGAAIGGTAGGVIGNKMDKQARDISTSIPGAGVQRVGEAIRVVLEENSVNFEFGKANLTNNAKANLLKLIPVFNEYPDTNLKVQGYTDSKGSDEYNLSLSEKRAAAVVNYLASNGVLNSRLTQQGMGEANPIADNETEEGRSINRRVEFIITANEDMIQDAQDQASQNN